MTQSVSPIKSVAIIGAGAAGNLHNTLCGGFFGLISSQVQ